MKTKLHIKKGYWIKAKAGDSNGQEGKVLSVDKVENWAFVEGVNLVSKHTKPTAQNSEGGIVKQEASVHLSNLMLIEPGTGKPTRIGRKLDEKTDKLVRFSRKSGEIIK